MTWYFNDHKAMPGGKTTKKTETVGRVKMRNALLFLVRCSDRQQCTCHVYATEFACVLCVWFCFPQVCGWVPACGWVHNLKLGKGRPASSGSPRVNVSCPLHSQYLCTACELMDTTYSCGFCGLGLQTPSPTSFPVSSTEDFRLT